MISNMAQNLLIAMLNDLPQEERDAHQHQQNSSAAGEEADEADVLAQGSNANAQDADFDASAMFRYAHARRFHLLRTTCEIMVPF